MDFLELEVICVYLVSESIEFLFLPSKHFP